MAKGTAINRKQQGLTTLSLLTILAIGGLLLTAAFKLGPLYLDNYFIRAAINSLAQEQLSEMPDRAIRQKLSTVFNINNIRDVDIKLVKIHRDKNKIVVSLDYEKRVNFMGNLDFVAVFANEYDSSKQQ